MKKRLSTGPGLIIGIPTLGRPIPLQWAFAFKSLTTPINYNVNIHCVPGKEVAIARIEMAMNAIEKDAKYLFFLSDDVVPPAFAIKQLIFRMEQDEKLGVVGGVYCSKCDPAAPLVFRGNGQGSYWDWKVGEYFPVTGMGMDCTLIRVQVLKDLLAKGSELFKTVDTDSFLDGINNAEAWTEDLYFFDQMEKLTPEWKIFIDGGVICEHWDIYNNKAYTLPTGSLPMRQLMVPEDRKKCLIVGTNKPVDIAEKDQFEVVQFGQYEEADYRGEPNSLPFDAVFDWVIVYNSGFQLDNTEWLRVLKPGGKLSIFYNPLIDLQKVINVYKCLTEEPGGVLVMYKDKE